MKKLRSSQRNDGIAVGMRWFRVAVFVLLAVFLCTGCAKKGAVVARPVGERTAAAVELEGEIKKTISMTPTIKAFAEITIILRNRVRRTQAAIVVERPSNLRIDIMDELADVLAQLGSVDGDLWLYVPDGGGLYTGKSARRGLSRVTGLSLNAFELISVFSGIPPITDESVILESTDGLSFTVNGGTFRLWTDRAKGHLLGFEKISKRHGYKVELGDYRLVGGAWFPCEIRVSVPRKGAEVVLIYRDVTIGASIGGDPFLSPRQ